MLPCESATTISPAPAARAAAMAAFASSVMSSRNFAYSNPSLPSCSSVTAPATPSMSTEMKMRGPDGGGSGTWAEALAEAIRAARMVVMARIGGVYVRVTIVPCSRPATGCRPTSSPS